MKRKLSEIKSREGHFFRLKGVYSRTILKLQYQTEQATRTEAVEKALDIATYTLEHHPDIARKALEVTDEKK